MAKERVQDHAHTPTGPTQVKEAWRSDGTHIILKTAVPGPDAQAARARLEQEYRILEGLRIPGVIRTLGLTTTADGLALELEAFDGQSLAERWTDVAASVDDTLDIAVRLAEIISRIHEAGIVHRDITPSNVLFNAERLDVRLIDFGMARRLDPNTVELPELGVLRGTPGYCAPEQTGHVNRPLGATVDQHGLGAVLYELLTGRPPFGGKDLRQRVYRTVAAAPLLPQSLEPSVPPALAAIVMKLLGKMEEDRYDSMRGVLTDLRRCLLEYRNLGQIKPFEPGMAEQQQVFQLPQRLFGRTRQVQKLQEALTVAQSGRVALSAVVGPGGSGKTAIVEALRPVSAARGGYFTVGKCDQARTNHAGAAIADAIRGLMDEVLRKSNRNFEAWREQILEAVGDNGPLLGEIMPSAVLELIGASDKPLPELPPQETRDRFRQTLGRLLQALAQQADPLTLFVDDAQWADSATLDLIETVADTRHPLLLILAWRDDEVSSDHPLHARLEKLRQAAQRVVEATPLDVDAVSEIVGQAMGTSPSEVRSLARIVVAKTHGNAFFTREWLLHLHNEGLLEWDESSRAWKWSEDRLAEQPLADNVGALLARRLRDLPDHVQGVLCAAAHIGNTVEFDLLRSALNQPAPVVADAVIKASESQLLYPVGGTLRTLRQVASHHLSAVGDTENAVLRFPHDRLQEAAMRLRDGEALAALRLSLARQLSEAEPDRLLDITDHYNAAHPLITEAAELRRLARLNLDAGRRVSRTAAFEVARRYYTTGLGLLGEAGWDNDHGLTWALHVRSAQAALMTGDQEAHSEFAETLVARASNAEQHVIALDTRIKGHLARYDNKAALADSRAALAICGVSLPANATKLAVARAMMKTAWAMRGRSPESLVTLPVATDPMARWAARFLISAVTPAFYTDVQLIPILLLALVQQALDRGVTPQSSYGVVGYAMIQAAAFNQLDRARALAATARGLIDRFDARDLAARVLTVEHGFITWRYQDMRAALSPQRKMYRAALDAGDAEYAALCAHNHLMFCLLAGLDLRVLTEEGASAVEACRKLDQIRNVNAVQLLQQVVANLREPGGAMAELDGDYLRREEYLAIVDSASDRAGRAALLIYEVMLAVIAGEFKLGVQRATTAAASVEALLGAPQLGLYWAYGGLACACLAGEIPEQRRALLRRAGKHLKALRRWTRGRGGAFDALERLLTATIAAERGETDAAAAALDKAIDTARISDNQLESALALEFAARYYHHLGRARIAATYVREALLAWSQYGSPAKRDAMDALIRDITGALPLALPGDQRTIAITPSTIDGSKLDVESLLDAARTVSSEIRLDDLVHRLMSLIVEQSAAQTALLALPGPNDRLQVVGHAFQKDGRTQSRVFARDDRRRPASLLPRADGPMIFASRTHEPMFLSAGRPDPATQSSEITPARSAMALPIETGSELVAVLYLENDLAADVFNAQRTAVVQVLAAQAAVSIGNARLYEELGRRLDREQALTRSYERFVPKEFLLQLGRDSITDVVLGDKVERRVTVMFVDVWAFTSLAETLGAERTFDLVNQLLSRLGPIVRAHGGFIDKFVGDAMMALFPGPPDRAVQAAMAIQRSMAKAAPLEGHVVRVGIGMQYGLVVLGTIGEAVRMDSTVISDAVNVASRLERLTRAYDAGILVGGELASALESGRFEHRSLGPLSLRGRARRKEVVEILDPEAFPEHKSRLASAPELEVVVERLAHGDFESARKLLLELRESHPTDSVIEAFLNGVVDGPDAPTA